MESPQQKVVTGKEVERDESPESTEIGNVVELDNRLLEVIGYKQEVGFALSSCETDVTDADLVSSSNANLLDCRLCLTPSQSWVC